MDKSIIGNKLKVKDFMTVGIFAALYFVVYFATMMLGYIPIMMTVMPLITAITAGIPFMLFITRAKKMWMMTLFGIVCGLLALIMGSGIYPLITAVVVGLSADLILKSGDYKSTIKSIIAYCLLRVLFLVSGIHNWDINCSHTGELGGVYG